MNAYPNVERRESVSGFCACGCGRRTSVYTKNNLKRGQVKGEPTIYAVGHSRVGRYTRGADTPLTQEKLRAELHYCPQTGIFTRLKDSRGAAMGDMAGTPNGDGYLRIGVLGRKYKAHRLAWFYVHGRWPEPFIDHINRVRSDNRLENLREATALDNAANRDCTLPTRTGHRGVTPHRGKFQVTVGNRYIGVFATIEQALTARYEAIRSET